MTTHSPLRPITGASMMVISGKEALIIKRGKEPSKGLWAFPGGGQELGETLEGAARRELFEETGLTAVTTEFLRFFEPIRTDEHGAIISHYVLGLFICREFTGTVCAGDDAADAAWVTLGKMSQFDFTSSTEEILLELLTEN